MSHVATKRSHYNPCFWTALWNKPFFESWLRDAPRRGKRREQLVWVLNLRGCKILQDKVANVHFDKDLGVAEITNESAERFCRRWFPDELPGVEAWSSAHPGAEYFIDFEDVLAGMERFGVYGALMKAARIGRVDSLEHKGFVACALALHAMRSHELMADMTEGGAIGLEKFEYFWLLRNAFGNPLILGRAAVPLASGQWILYRADDHRFPLCDSPVMVNRGSMMAVLSPRLLLEINLNVAGYENLPLVRDRISASKFREFRHRAIGNTFKEIIFSDRAVLEEWQSSREFRVRVAALCDPAKAAECIRAASKRVKWALSGFGRISPSWEEWAPTVFAAARGDAAALREFLSYRSKRLP